MMAVVLATAIIAAVWWNHRPGDATELPVLDVEAVAGIDVALAGLFETPPPDEETEAAQATSTAGPVPSWSTIVPEPLGVVDLTEKAIAGLKYPPDAATDAIYVAVLLNAVAPGEWVVESSTIVCDPKGKGIVFTFPGDPGWVAVLGGSAPGTAHVGRGIEVSDGHQPMQVWEIPSLASRYHVLALNDTEPTTFCGG